jgi:two-component sensor histidine kinase
MTHTFERLFGPAELSPLGTHLSERPDLLALHALSDTAIAIAYLAIPAAIWVFLRKRRDLPRSAQMVALLFVAFIISGSLAHLASALSLYFPIFAVLGVLKMVMAATAVATAIVIWPQIPKLLALPSPRDLARSNLALMQANASLETTIAWRTHELELANQRFEQALSRSNTTVFTQDRDLRYTWVHNPRPGHSEEDLIGRTAAEIGMPDAGDESVALKRHVLETGETASAVVAVPTESEGRLYIDMTVSPTVDRTGVVDGILCTAVDVTEKRLFEVRLAAMAGQLGAAYQRFELALDNSAITVFEQDAELRYTYMYNPPPGTEAADFLGRTDGDIFPEAEAAVIGAPKQRVLATGASEKAELEVEVGGVERFFDLRLEPRTDDTGAVEGIIGTALDLTQHRRDEQRMRLMMRELTHRSKNLLAVIQAMARKTASLSDDVDGFITDFSSRLRAMAAAHDLLVSQSWHGADLGDLLRASVAQTIAPTAEQVHMDGPPLTLAPDTAQNLGLAFHELATNASKYGALAADHGELAVTWRHEDGEVKIRWQESDGPPVALPTRQGFGRVLLERLVGATLNGSVSLDFRPEGLVCEIVFPDDHLIAS